MLQKIYRVNWKFKLVLAGLIAVGGFWGWQVAQHRSMVLLALDTHTGTLQWFHVLGAWDDFYSRGPLVANGTVILESAESSAPQKRLDTYRLRAFSARSGEGLWARQVDAPATNTTTGFGYELASNSVVQLQSTALYLQSGDELRSLDLSTGQPRWSIRRPWFNNGERANLWLNLGIAATQQRVGVVFLDPQRQRIQFLDATTGRVLRQTPFPATDWLTNFSRIAQNDRTAFITNGSANEASRVITAYSLDTGQILFRQPFEGSINNVQATDKTLLLSTDVVSNPKQPDRRIEGQMVALNSQNGRLRWQRSNSQLQCVNYASTWQADSQSVYLNCDRRNHGIQGSSTIVALSTQTGEIRWQTVISPNRHSKDIPIAVSKRQLLTLRQVNQGERLQTQAIAL
jgi:outer membrane protein assembly factor BamB